CKNTIRDLIGDSHRSPNGNHRAETVGDVEVNMLQKNVQLMAKNVESVEEKIILPGPVTQRKRYMSSDRNKRNVIVRTENHCMSKQQF
ncbi:MAG: hypothetical protein ACRCW5_03265, partial [Cetobacterium sp.]|uniref:hypothetical protein n=1 Tax=Cetobacterium sp. TaxID=2071632 RepID=UPI003F3771DC